MKMKKCLLVISIIILFAQFGGAELPVTEQRDILDKIRESVSLLKVSGEVAKFSDTALKGRLAGSEGANRVAKMIASEFERNGLSHLTWLDLHSYHMSFPLIGREGEKTGLTGYNLVGLIRGESESKRYYLVGAHYDYLGGNDDFVYRGADDAAGVSAVLEIMRIIKKLDMKPKHHIIFVVFSGSMWGFQGAAEMAARLKEKDYEQLGMLYLHRLGGTGGNKIDVFTEDYPGGKFLWEAMQEAGKYYGVTVDVRDENDGGSDAYMFVHKGLPAAGINWDWSKKHHPYYETTLDNINNTNTDGLIKTITVTAGALWLLANK
mgnify:CR=1 FL=1